MNVQWVDIEYSSIPESRECDWGPDEAGEEFTCLNEAKHLLLDYDWGNADTPEGFHAAHYCDMHYQQWLELEAVIEDR